MATVEPLKEMITVDLPPNAAFELFTAEFGTWWPAEFSWSQPDPDQASVVTVTFAPADGSTRVDVTHDEWERHGDWAQTYRDDFSQAWPMAVDRYRQATEA